MNPEDPTRPSSQPINQPPSPAPPVPEILPTAASTETPQTSQLPPNPERRVSQSEPGTEGPTMHEVPRPKNKFAILVIVLLFLTSIGSLGFWVYQKYFVSSPAASPEPSAQVVVPTATPDVTATWKTYTNKIFIIKLPDQFETDARYSTSPSDMHFSWSEPKNATPVKSMDIMLGYTSGDPKLATCKTDEECYQGYAKSFSVAGYNKIVATINGKQTNGFETSSTASGVLTYQNFYPVSLSGKLFTFDFQMSAPSLEEAKQFVPQVNQILSTFKFLGSQSSTITAEKAAQIVSSLPEVKTFFANTSNAKISLDSTQSSDKFWAFQVYESFPDHNATFHWYNVDKTSGEVTKKI